MPMLSPGFRIGDHEVIRYAALGAMCEVYEGRHVSDGKAVAVKVLSPEWWPHPELVARFLNEAHALQHVRHASIVTIFSWGTLPDGPPFMVLEWLPVNLHQVLASAGGRLPPPAATRIALQLADALASLHESGIVHRDLKPANVLLLRDAPLVWEVKLADLGLAKLLSGEQAAHAQGEPRALSAMPVSTGASSLLGTWDYMAPEQWVQSKSVGPMADVYALGVLLFQLLVGRLPFIAEQQRDLMYLHLVEPPPVGLLDGLVSAGLRDLVARMLRKKPSPRPTMREVLEHLSGLS